MILQFLKRYHPLILFIIPLLVFSLWLKPFSEPITFEHNISLTPLSKGFVSFLSGFGTYPIWIICIGLVFICAFLLFKIDSTYNLSTERTLLTAVIYALLSGSNLSMNGQTIPTLISSIFLLLTVIIIFSAYKKPRALSEYFNASLILSIGSMFYLDLIFYIVFIWISLINIRPFVWREWVLSLMGLITPYFFYFSLIFIIKGSISDYILPFYNHFMAIQPNENITISHLILYVYLVILIILGSIYLLRSYSKKNISTRKYYTLIFWIFLVSIALLFIPSGFSLKNNFLLIIPLCFLFTNLFISIKSKWFSEIVFILFLLIIFLTRTTYLNQPIDWNNLLIR